MARRKGSQRKVKSDHPGGKTNTFSDSNNNNNMNQKKAVNNSSRPTTPNQSSQLPTMLTVKIKQEPNVDQDLTWSNLMVPKNFPKAYSGETSTSTNSKVPDAGLPKSSSTPMTLPNRFSSSNKNSRSPEHTVIKSSTSIPTLPNRFSTSLSGNSNKVTNQNEQGNLDLSKKHLPAEIRRILATKYNHPKRSEEGSSVVPNFAKSRSRFTVGAKKANSDGEQNDKTTSANNARPSNTSLSGDEGSTEKMTSSTSLSTETDNKNLESQGMLDLASHYGNLLKESSPTVPPRSKSQSPRTDEITNTNSEGMIDLGSTGRFKDYRPVPLRRPGEGLINLNALEAPTSPLSPSFRPAGFGMFPSPMIHQGYQPMKAKPKTFQPRIPLTSQSSSPAPGAMINLATFGKKQEPPTRGPELLSIPGQVAHRILPKRRHSVDSSTLREVKRACTEQKKDDNVETPVKIEPPKPKLNIGDVLQLEQEEQNCIKDLSTVQNKVANIRFKMQLMKQEMEALQASETEIKQHIDNIRAKRVRILKEAQEHEQTSTKKTASVEKNVDRNKIPSLMDKVYPAFERNSVKHQSPLLQSSNHNLGEPERKGRSETLTDLEAEENELMRGSERIKSRRVDIDKYGGYQYSNHPLLNNRSQPPQPPYDNFGNDIDNTSDKMYQKRSGLLDDVGMVDNGNVVATHHSSQREHHVGKSMCMVKEIMDNHNHKDTRQFLGCLEISSTTEESVMAHEEGPKEILAEEERESIVKSVSSNQEKISSTVSNLDKEGDTLPDSSDEKHFVGHSDAICAIVPFKNRLFSASADRTVRVFDLKTEKCIETFKGHAKGINCLRIHTELGDKTRLFTGSNDQTVRVYNMKSGSCTHKFSFRERVMCLHTAFGKLFVGLSSGFVAVIDLKTNKYIDQFNCHEPSRISCLASASEGQRSLLCTGSFDSTITIRDQSSGLLLRTITDHKLTVLCMQVVENIIFSGSADTVVQSHNINTGQLVRSYTGHTMSVSGLQALGGVLITTSLDRIIRCFDIKSGDLLQLYGGNNDMIFSLAVFKDMIYTGCRDGKLSGIKLDLRKYHCCRWSKCGLKFGLVGHLKQHVQDHINQTYVFDSCLWEGCCFKFHRGKQLDVIQSAIEHVNTHVEEK